MKEAKLNVIYIDAADVTIPDTANLIDKIIVLTEKADNFKFTDGSGTEGVPGGIYKYNGTTWEKGKGLVSLPKLIYLYDGLVKRLNGDGYKIESGTSEATNAGKYEASLALVDSTYWWSDGDTAGRKTVKWEITPMAIDKLSISVEDQIYTGSPLEPDVTVMHGNKKLVKDTDYILSYENNTKVGTATVTIDGKGNYDGQAQINFNIVSTPGTDPGTDPETPEPGTSPSSGGFPMAVVAVGVFAYFMFLRPKP